MVLRHQKIHRLIAGALLGSELSSRELMELSERLRFDRTWTDQLANFMEELAHITSLRPIRRYGESPRDEYDERSSPVDEIVDIFRSKRLRKTDALEILVAFAGGQNWMPNPGETLRQNVHQLLKSLPRAKEKTELINNIVGALSTHRDPYLRKLLE